RLFARERRARRRRRSPFRRGRACRRSCSRRLARRRRAIRSCLTPQLGDPHRVSYANPAVAEHKSMEGNMSDYVLEIVEGPEAGRLIPLNGPTELGRDPGAGIALLQDELISRRHAKITPVDDGLQVEDLDSQNGTFVDGDQIYSPAHVSLGHQLLVGVSVLEL